MSTLRISNIEAKADNSSPTVDEQLKFTNSTGDVLLHLDGRTSGITTVGINTTAQTIKFDENNNVYITGIVTATELHGTVAVGTSITYGDNEKAYFGTGLDLQIFHNTSDSVISQSAAGTGNLKILSGGAQSIECVKAGAVNIAHNGNTKLATTSTGAKVTGVLEADASSTNYPIKVSGSANAKINLTGATSPYIQWQEGTTNRAYAWWDSNYNRFELKNEQENSYIRLDSVVSLFSAGTFGFNTSTPYAYDTTATTFEVKGPVSSAADTEVARFRGGSDADGGTAVLRLTNNNDRGLVVKGGRESSASEFAEFGLSSFNGTYTRAIKIKSNGNIGVGDNNPDTRLSVTAASGTDVVGKFTSTDAKAWIQFRDNSTTDTGVMIGAEGDDMMLRAGSNERIRIKSGGQLCVGTTSGPGEPGLYLGDGTNPAGHIYANSTHHMYLLANAYFSSSWKYLGNGEAQQLSMADGVFSFLTAGNNSSGQGNGINWQTRLSISADQNIYIWGNETGNNRAILYNGPGYFGIYGSSSNSVNRQLRFHTAGGSASERMRLSSDGFFLVNCQDTGFSNGFTDMTIGNTSQQNTGLTIASSSSNGLSRLHFADGNSGAARYAGWIVYDHANDQMKFSTGNSGSARLVFDTNGTLQFGGVVSGGPYSNGGAINLIDFGSGTLNRGMGWGGTNANYANIWTEYSTGALHLGMGIRPEGTSTGWKSSYGGGSIGRSALKMDLNGDIRIFTGSGSQIAAGGATNLTEKLLIHRTGAITHQFSGRYGVTIGSTNGAGAYILLDGAEGSPIASGSDYMYMEHASDGDFEMWNGKNGVQTSKFMDVTPEGYMTKPKTPHCAAYLDTNRTVGSNGIHKFSDSGGFGGHYFTAVKANTGGHYNSSNSRFTVPKSGYYLLTMNMAMTGSNPGNYGSMEWYLNGSRAYVGGWQRGDGTGYHRFNSTHIWSLTKDDYIEPGFELHTACTFNGSTDNRYRYLGFTITLLH